MLQRLARAIWWLGVPLAFLGWLLAPRESVIYVSSEPFSIEVNTLRSTLPPILGELAAAYRVTAAALVLLIAVTVASHVRRTRAVRAATLLLPAHVAAFEACLHFAWVGRRHSITHMPSYEELHQQFHTAAIASVLAVVLALVVAAVLVRACPAARGDRPSRRLLSGLAPLVSVVLVWAARDWIFFHYDPR